MNPLFIALLICLSLVCLLSMLFVWQLDKNAEIRAATRRAKRGAPDMAPLPKCVAMPAAWRRADPLRTRR